jgi:hypothetical protein
MPSRRRYRRKSSLASSIVRDVAYVGNRVSWRFSLVYGVVLFVAFYWVVPALLLRGLERLRGNPLYPLLDAVFARRVHWSQWLAIALALLCGFFALRAYFRADPLAYRNERRAGLLSRLLARWIDD